MSPGILPSGPYFIINVGQAQYVGVPRTLPTIQPIIAIPQPQTWHVKHIKDHLYILTIHDFVTVAKDDLAWGYLEPPTAQEWVIRLEQRAGEINEYTILETSHEPHGGKGWTLEGKDTQVSLEFGLAQPSEPPRIDPKQLWSFQAFSV